MEQRRCKEIMRLSNFFGSALMAAQSGNWYRKVSMRMCTELKGRPFTLPVFKVSTSRISNPGAQTNASLLRVNDNV